MVADLRTMMQGLFTSVLLIGSLSAGSPIPQDAPNVIPTPSVGETPMIQLSDVETPQESQKLEILPTSETPSDAPLMVAPVGEPPVGVTPISVTPTSDPSVSAPVMSEPLVSAPAISEPPVSAPTMSEPQLQQTAPQPSKSDCPEMREKHIVLCEADDSIHDKFQMAPLPKEPPTPEVNEATQ